MRASEGIGLIHCLSQACLAAWELVRPIKSDLNLPGPEEKAWWAKVRVGVGGGLWEEATAAVPQYGFLASGTTDPGEEGGGGATSEWEWDLIRLRTGTRGRQGRAGHPGGGRGRGQGTGSKSMPKGGLEGDFPTPSTEQIRNHRLSGAPTLRSSGLSSVVGAYSFPRQSGWERTRDALLSVAATALPPASGSPLGLHRAGDRALAR